MPTNLIVEPELFDRDRITKSFAIGATLLEVHDPYMALQAVNAIAFDMVIIAAEKQDEPGYAGLLSTVRHFMPHTRVLCVSTAAGGESTLYMGEGF